MLDDMRNHWRERMEAIIGMVREVFYSFVFGGLYSDLTIKTISRTLLATIFSFVAGIFLFIFALESLSSGHSYHAAFLFILFLLLAGVYIYLRLSRNYRFFNNFIIYEMAVLCLYLICTGGISNTGPLWYYVFPLLAFYVQGPRKGLISLCLLVGATMIILFVPDFPIAFAKYPMAFKTRFLGSFAAVTLMSFTYEYTRHRIEQIMLELSRRLDKMAHTDELTGLANRREMTRKLQYESFCSARDQTIFSIIMGDIDFFKQINDRYGHDCGDHVLKTIAGVLVEALRRHDIVSRWGGEEFLMLLPGTDYEECLQVAERVRAAVEQCRISYQGNTFNLTISLGITTPLIESGIDSFIKRADDNLYRAKAEGKNRVMGSR